MPTLLAMCSNLALAGEGLFGALVGDDRLFRLSISCLVVAGPSLGDVVGDRFGDVVGGLSGCRALLPRPQDAVLSSHAAVVETAKSYRPLC